MNLLKDASVIVVKKKSSLDYATWLHRLLFDENVIDYDERNGIRRCVSTDVNCDSSDCRDFFLLRGTPSINISKLDFFFIL